MNTPENAQFGGNDVLFHLILWEIIFTETAAIKTSARNHMNKNNTYRNIAIIDILGDKPMH